MRVLLVRPPSPRMPVVIPALGLGYLASSLAQHGHTVHLLDCARDGLDHRAFTRELSRFRPHVLGLQVLSCDLGSARRCLELARRWNAAVVTVVGGAHPSGDPEGVLDLLRDADYAFEGEAELGLPALLQRLDAGSPDDLSGVDGLAYREDGRAVCSGPAVVADLDSLPWPAWELIDPRRYRSAPHGTFVRQLPTAPVITTRGCPYACTYCAGSTVHGRTLRRRSAEGIVEEILYLRDRLGVREIHIEDDNFTLDRRHVLGFCEEFRARGVGLPWALPNGVKLETLDQEVARAMEAAGCYSLAVGVESGSPPVLQAMNRSLPLDAVVERIRMIAAATRIRITGMFVLGYPTESLDDMERTLALALELPLSRAQFGLFLPLPGTQVFDALVASGEIAPERLRWEAYQVDRVVYSPPGVAPDQLRRMARKAFLSFYLRPRIARKLLEEVRSTGQAATIVRRALAVLR